MKRLVQSLVILTPLTLAAQSSATNHADPALSLRVVPSAAPVACKRPADYWAPERQASWRAWKRSLIPMLASQGLDMASSYGMRERNPLLAGGDGRFGGRAMAIKGGVVGAIVGIEYLVAKKYPRAARAIARLNWSSSVVTAAFAAHNFAIK